MRTMTKRNVPPELDAALKEESLGVGGKPRSNGLHRLAGAWSEAEFQQFEKSVAPFDEIDEDLWR